MDKNDKALRVVGDFDYEDSPDETASIGGGLGAAFNLTAADEVGALRADGSIKLRMVVHLYLPE